MAKKATQEKIDEGAVKAVAEDIAKGAAADVAAEPAAATVATQQRLVERPWFCKLLILASALAWGFSFLVMKDITALFPVFWLLLVRFAIATLLMLLFFHKHIRANLDKGVIKAGVILGIFYGVAYVFQTYGVVYTTPGKNAFLTGVYCVLVPFCSWALGQGKPKSKSLIAAGIALVGMGLVVLDNGFPLNLGDMLTLVCAVFYALEMAVVAIEGRGKDVWALTFWQFLTISIIMLVGTIVVEQPPAPELFTPENIAALAFLAFICSFATLALLNYGLTKVDPASGALLSSMESPSGVAFSVAFGYEILTPKLLLGFILIFCGILYSELGDKLGKGKSTVS